MLPLQNITSKEWWLSLELIQRSELLLQPELSHFGCLCVHSVITQTSTADAIPQTDQSTRFQPGTLAHLIT